MSNVLFCIHNNHFLHFFHPFLSPPDLALRSFPNPTVSRAIPDCNHTMGQVILTNTMCNHPKGNLHTPIYRQVIWPRLAWACRGVYVGSCHFPPLEDNNTALTNSSRIMLHAFSDSRQGQTGYGAAVGEYHDANCTTLCLKETF
jgi:hypothetical protein